MNSRPSAVQRSATYSLAMCLLAAAGCPAPVPNQAPTADAGADLSASGGEVVTLDGSMSSDADGDALSFSWAQTAGPAVALVDADTESSSFTAPNLDVTLRFALLVSDTEGETGVDTLHVVIQSVDNLPPTADAGPDQVISGVDTVILSGAGSSDPDGDQLAFSWMQTGGVPVVLSDADTNSPTFTTENADATLMFELTVSDGSGHIDTDEVTVTVARVPPVLFVSNAIGNSVSSFVEPATADGNVEPETTLAGDLTQLASPRDIVVTRVNLLVAATTSSDVLTLHINAETADGDSAPLRTTVSVLLDQPRSLAYDADRDLVIVSNSGASNDILLFSGPTLHPQGFVTNLTLVGTISSAALNLSTGMDLDARDNLYVANRGNKNILVFGPASVADEPVEPLRTIVSSSFADPVDVFVDRFDNLYVLETGGSIFVFSNARDLAGAVVPDRTITVNGANFLSAIAVDRADTAYISDVGSNAVYSYDGLSTLSGNCTPDRTIAGDRTNLSGPTGLFLLED